MLWKYIDLIFNQFEILAIEKTRISISEITGTYKYVPFMLIIIQIIETFN